MELGFDILIILRLKTLQKIGVGAGILAVIAALYWYVWFTQRQESIEALETTLQEQQTSIESKEKMLAQLPKLRQELEALKLKEAASMRQLPSSKDIPTLLTDISRAGHDQGLEFNLFAPKPEQVMQFYAEVPVDITVEGGYHSLALFMERVASFSRIVNFSDLTLTLINTAPGKGKERVMRTADINLSMSARLTTYRFIEPPADAKKGGK